MKKFIFILLISITGFTIDSYAQKISEDIKYKTSKDPLYVKLILPQGKKELITKNLTGVSNREIESLYLIPRAEFIKKHNINTGKGLEIRLKDGVEIFDLQDLYKKYNITNAQKEYKIYLGSNNSPKYEVIPSGNFYWSPKSVIEVSVDDTRKVIDIIKIP